MHIKLIHAHQQYMHRHIGALHEQALYSACVTCGAAPTATTNIAHIRRVAVKRVPVGRSLGCVGVSLLSRCCITRVARRVARRVRLLAHSDHSEALAHDTRHAHVRFHVVAANTRAADIGPVLMESK